MRNATYSKLEQLYQKFPGYIDTKELLQAGFTNRQIAVLVDEKYLEKVCHGHYWMLQSGCQKPFDYKCIEVCLSNPKAVIAMESACYYQGIGKEAPEVLTVATERTDRRTMKMNFPMERHYFSSSNFKLGMKKIQTKMGSYNIYEPERCLCDVMRLDGEQAGEKFWAEILDGTKLEEGQHQRILEYAKLLRVKGLPI